MVGLLLWVSGAMVGFSLSVLFRLSTVIEGVAVAGIGVILALGALVVYGVDQMRDHESDDEKQG